MLLQFVIGSAQAVVKMEEWYVSVLRNCRSVLLSTILNKDKEVVSNGMIEMYDKEVLSRYVVTKSFIYSGCLPR
jgi:hypothetical protein